MTRTVDVRLGSEGIGNSIASLTRMTATGHDWRPLLAADLADWARVHGVSPGREPVDQREAA